MNKTTNVILPDSVKHRLTVEDMTARQFALDMAVKVGASSANVVELAEAFRKFLAGENEAE